MSFWKKKPSDDDDDDIIDELVANENKAQNEERSAREALSSNERDELRKLEKEASDRAHIFRSELVAIGPIAGPGEAVCTIAYTLKPKRIIFILGPKGLASLHMGVVVTDSDLEAIQGMIAEFRHSTQTKRGSSGQ